MDETLILAQGKSSRWGNYMGIPKHLINIGGETIISRACRLFSNSTHVKLICPNDERYPIGEFDRYTLENPFPYGTEMDKFLATKELWNKNGATTIAWGDCYYTEHAVRTICEYINEGDIRYFRRPYKSSITGHKWDESFAVKFMPEQHAQVEDIALKVVEMVLSKKIKKDHIRTHYALYLGINNFSDRALLNTPHQTIIDDWTDDIDSPKEYVEFTTRYKKNFHNQDKKV